MENILDKNNAAHIRSYEGIRDIIFKKKKGKHQVKNVAANNVQYQPQQVNHNVQKPTQNNPSSSQKQKGKAKFRDINTYQVKQKQKEGKFLLLLLI